jgi:hypothetical protein
VSANLTFWVPTSLGKIVVLYDVTFAKLIIFDCLLSVEIWIRATEQVQVVIVIPVIIEVSPGLGLAEKIWEVGVITTRETLKSKTVMD